MYLCFQTQFNIYTLDCVVVEVRNQVARNNSEIQHGYSKLNIIFLPSQQFIISDVRRGADRSYIVYSQTVTKLIVLVDI